ncbi:hypothetical protein [Corynebacterium glyciniphilum]|uniref:hypothetical protein n=1 Tax=Corynebacterium glyciniphilum TaxID=1404244 RepID=UPI003FD4C457
MAIQYRFYPPRTRNGQHAKSHHRFQKCPDCGAYLWYTPSEDLFYCKIRSCYYVADYKELEALVMPEINRLNQELKEEEDRENRRRRYERAQRESVQKNEGFRSYSVVYYLRFADRIKIGTTYCISGRMEALPWDEVLVMEPGSFKKESARHKQFADCHAMQEWFFATPELMDHITGLRESLADFNAARFPDQGPFPWKAGEVHLGNMMVGDIEALRNEEGQQYLTGLY